MATGPKGGWGGKREGSGRKKETLSGNQVREMLAKAKKYAEKHGKTIDEILLDIIYAEETGVKDQLAGIKLWKEYTIAKIQEGGDTDTELGPNIFLPEKRPDTSNVVELNGK